MSPWSNTDPHFFSPHVYQFTLDLGLVRCVVYLTGTNNCVRRDDEANLTNAAAEYIPRSWFTHHWTSRTDVDRDQRVTTKPNCYQLAGK